MQILYVDTLCKYCFIHFQFPDPLDLNRQLNIVGSTFEPQIKLARKHIKLRTYYGQKYRCAFHPIYTARDFDRQYH